MRSSKGSRRIVVEETEYRWRATGNDGWISISIWPANNIGPMIAGNFKYDETRQKTVEGGWMSAQEQIVVTNRVIRRVIQLAFDDLGYDPDVKGADLQLRSFDNLVDWADAIRATKKPS